MIYIFAADGNNVSIVYDGNTLTEEQKQRATKVVEKLPIAKTVEGKEPILKYDNAKDELYYEYIDALPVPLPEQEQPEPTLEEQIAELKEDNLILMDALATVFEEVLSLKEEQSK